MSHSQTSGRDATSKLAAGARAAIVGFALVQLGCSFLPSHLHNSDRSARTAKLAETVDQYGKKSPGIYDALLKSSRAVAAEQDKVLTGLAANRDDAFIQMLPFQTGENLATTSNNICTTLNETQGRLISAVYTYVNEKAGAEHDAKAAREAIKVAQEKVEVAKQNVTNWNSTLAVLETAVAELPSVSQSVSADSKQVGLDTLQKQLKAAGDKEVQYVDADGVTHKKKISEILKDQINVNSEGKPLLNIPDAPGATVAILTLGVELANVEKRAAEVKLAQLSRRLELYERVQAEIALAYALLHNLDVSCGDSESSLIIDRRISFSSDVVLVADEARASERGEAEAAIKVKSEGEQKRRERLLTQIDYTQNRTLELAEALAQLRELAIARAIGTRTSMDLIISEPRLHHEESILDSQVNDVAWRTVIRSGVVVLDQYEQGGFTAQDAADIIAIAQAIAVGVIAGRIH